MSSPAEHSVEKGGRALEASSKSPAPTATVVPNEQSDGADAATSGSSASSPSEPGELSEDETSQEPRSNGLKPASEPGGAEDSDADANAPPLPGEPVPQQEDDGWEYHWNANTNSYWFYNRITGAWQQENPRITGATSTAAPVTEATSANPPLPAGGAPAISAPGSIAGGYNPAIHGSYDPNAWYAQAGRAAEATEEADGAVDPVTGEYISGGYFNRATGEWQTEDQGPSRHSDDAKSRRQLNAFFDVDAAANAHDGRSLKAERAGKKPTKAELKAFKEKRRAKKEEKRRAWLRD